MATLKGLSRSKRSEALSKGVVVDTVRGVLRVRKWPRKRGTPKSALQRWWIDWFKQANKLAKYADGMAQARAIEITKDSGMYPRDIMLAAMRGRLYIWQDQTGKTWYPMAAIQDISESLDVLAQDIGSVLVRAVDRWRAAVPGNVGDILTYRGPANPPEWLAPAGGGGAVQEVLPGTPIVPDGTVSFYDLDVSTYNSVNVQWDAIGMSGNNYATIRLSTDGGLTFKAGASDYQAGYVLASGDAWQALSAIYGGAGSVSSNHKGTFFLSNLRVGRCAWIAAMSSASSNMIYRSGFPIFDGPITHIRLIAISSGNFNAGTFRVVGER